MVSADPLLVDCVPAGDALGLRRPPASCAPGARSRGRRCARRSGAPSSRALRYEGLGGHGVWRQSGWPRRARCASSPATITRPWADDRIGDALDARLVVENRTSRNRAHVVINEGARPGPPLRRPRRLVLERLAWLRDEAGPLLGRAARRSGGIPLRSLMAQALLMGTRCTSGTWRPRRSWPGRSCSRLCEDVREPGFARLAAFVCGNDQFFLNLAMAAAKAATDPVADVPGSTIVTVMARNGTEFGIRVAGAGRAGSRRPSRLRRDSSSRGSGPTTRIPISATRPSWRRSAFRRHGHGCPRRRPRASSAPAGSTPRSPSRPTCARSRSGSTRTFESRRTAIAGARGHRRAARRGDRDHAAHQYRDRGAPRRHGTGRRGDGARASRLFHERARGAWLRARRGVSLPRDPRLAGGRARRPGAPGAGAVDGRPAARAGWVRGARA